MTLDLAAIKARYEATTRGTWVVGLFNTGCCADYPHGFGNPVPHPHVSEDQVIGFEPKAVHNISVDVPLGTPEHEAIIIAGDVEYGLGGIIRPADTIFCANAHQDVPEMVAEVEKLQMRLAETTLDMGSYRASLRGNQTQRELDKAVFDHHLGLLKDENAFLRKVLHEIGYTDGDKNAEWYAVGAREALAAVARKFDSDVLDPLKRKVAEAMQLRETLEQYDSKSKWRAFFDDPGEDGWIVSRRTAEALRSDISDLNAALNAQEKMLEALTQYADKSNWGHFIDTEYGQELDNDRWMIGLNGYTLAREALGLDGDK